VTDGKTNCSLNISIKAILLSNIICPELMSNIPYIMGQNNEGK
jgi:hypothetical protein